MIAIDARQKNSSHAKNTSYDATINSLYKTAITVNIESGFIQGKRANGSVKA